MNEKIPALEERQAIARLKQGHLSGMEYLVREHQARAINTAYLIVREESLAEDIVEAAFMRSAEKIRQFDSERPFGPWFLRSVVNAAIKAAERQKRLVSLDAFEDAETSSWVNLLLDPGQGPAEIAESEETREMVWKALGQLTPEQRGAVVMRHFLEMDESEITRELGRPSTTVRWWLRSARTRLREILGPFWQSNHPEPAKPIETEKGRQV